MLRGVHHADDFQELGAVAAESLALKQCSLLDLQGELPRNLPRFIDAEALVALGRAP